MSLGETIGNHFAFLNQVVRRRFYMGLFDLLSKKDAPDLYDPAYSYYLCSVISTLLDSFARANAGLRSIFQHDGSLLVVMDPFSYKLGLMATHAGTDRFSFLGELDVDRLRELKQAKKLLTVDLQDLPAFQEENENFSRLMTPLNKVEDINKRRQAIDIIFDLKSSTAASMIDLIANSAFHSLKQRLVPVRQ